VVPVRRVSPPVSKRRSGMRLKYAAIGTIPGSAVTLTGAPLP